MSKSVDLAGLLGDAGLDAGATSAMQLTADTLGPAIMAGLGDVDIDDINTAEVTLVTLLIDDSSSIRFVAGNTEAVRDGTNGVVAALEASKQAGSVLISCRYLNRGVLYPYRMLSGAEVLDQANYNPGGGTPLYDQTAVTLTGVAAKLAEFEQGGVAARGVTAIVTDGADNSGPVAPTSLRQMVEGMLRTEQNIIIGVGISDAPKDCPLCGQDLKRTPPNGSLCPGCQREICTDFYQVFRDMGIRDEWILTRDNTDKDIRDAFAVVSQSAIRASQAAGAGFSQVLQGGITKP